MEVRMRSTDVMLECVQAWYTHGALSPHKWYKKTANKQKSEREREKERQLFVLVSTVLCFWGLTLRELPHSATTTSFSRQSIYMHTSSLDPLARKCWQGGPPLFKKIISFPRVEGGQNAQSEASVVINREALVLCR